MTGHAGREAVLAGCHAIVLAAGGASRFGGGKLLARLDDTPLVCRAVRAAFAAPVESVRVVIGADAEQVREAVLAAQTGDALRVVLEPLPSRPRQAAPPAEEATEEKAEG